MNFATNEDPDLRWHAINALGEIGTQADTVVPVLISALQVPAARPSAAVALGKFGTNAMSAVPALVELLNSRNDLTDKSIYTNSLESIDPGAAAKAGVNISSPGS